MIQNSSVVTKYVSKNILAEKTNYTYTSESSALKINFSVRNYGIKLIWDEIDTALADMGFPKITITQSVF